MNAKVVLDGLVLGESPRWHDGRLWVAGWAAHELITLDACGTRQVADRPASVPCCIGAGGALSHRRVRAGLGGDHPDGICPDAEGAVWAADAGNKHCVRVPEGGPVLQTVDADRGCFACTLGGAGGRTLYIVTAQRPGDFRTPAGQVLAVQVTVPSAGAAAAG
jgi:sugar lactone lactonase YvrE